MSLIEMIISMGIFGPLRRGSILVRHSFREIADRTPESGDFTRCPLWFRTALARRPECEPDRQSIRKQLHLRLSELRQRQVQLRRFRTGSLPQLRRTKAGSSSAMSPTRRAGERGDASGIRPALRYQPSLHRDARFIPEKTAPPAAPHWSYRIFPSTIPKRRLVNPIFQSATPPPRRQPLVPPPSRPSVFIAIIMIGLAGVLPMLLSD